MARTKTRSAFVKKCKKLMREHLDKHGMIITYLRSVTPRLYGNKPLTHEEYVLIRDMLNVAPDLTPDGYIKLLQVSGLKVKKKKEEELKQKFLTGRSLWRSRRRPRIGAVIAFKRDDQVYVGWSLCKTASGDRFDRYIGVYECLRTDDDGNYTSCFPIDNPKGDINLISVPNLIARTRNAMDSVRQGEATAMPEIMIPHTLLPHVEAMLNRAQRHFGVGRAKKEKKLLK